MADLVKTEWLELSKLRTEDERWYRRRVYGNRNDGVFCQTCRKSPQEKSLDFRYPARGKALYQYGLGVDVSVHDLPRTWLVVSEFDGLFCNRACLPKELEKRWAYQWRKHRNPNLGNRRNAIVTKSNERKERLKKRFVELGMAYGAVTIIASEEGISRQRVYQLLEGSYGKGSVPVLRLGYPLKK